MDTLRLTVLLVSMAIFLVALYESFSIVRIIGKMPRFWIFFIAAIAVLIGNRILEIGYPSAATSTIDTDVVPLIFSVLLLMWVYDMKKSFQRAAPRPKPELTAPEQV